MDGFEEQRIGMVEQQLRPNAITDKRLLAAMRSVPRERFLPEALRGFAYMDEAIEVLPAGEKGAARFLLSPLVQARLIQLAEITAQDAVLDLGCATGYSTAILARLARNVTGVEPEPGLAGPAKTNLEALHVANAEIAEVSFREPPVGPYDAIVIEGRVCAVPDRLLDGLKDGGRLVTVLATDGKWGRACVFTRVGDTISRALRLGAGAPALPGLAPEPSFAL